MKGKLVSKLGLHCHYIPPIEEASTILQRFLQEDFPKLIQDMKLSSSASPTDVNVIEPCGSFSALPVGRTPRHLDQILMVKCLSGRNRAENLEESGPQVPLQMLQTQQTLQQHCQGRFAVHEPEFETLLVLPGHVGLAQHGPSVQVLATPRPFLVRQLWRHFVSGLYRVPL